jgi:hypothetical protein
MPIAIKTQVDGYLQGLARATQSLFCHFAVIKTEKFNHALSGAFISLQFREGLS